MSHQAHRYNRAQLAQEANLRAQVPAGALTLAWRSAGATRITSLSMGLVGTLGALGAVLSIWGVAVTSYLAFKDDIVGGMMSRQAAVQHGYEDRIRDLRGQVDMLTSRHLVLQNEMEQRVDQVARRQALLETRQSIVASLNEQVAPARSAPRAAPVQSVAPVPASRPGDTVRLAPPAERHSRLESRPAPVELAAAHGFALASAPGRHDTIGRVEHSLARVEQHQQAALQALETRTERRARRIRSVLTELGLGEARVARAPAASTAGTGGPLIPIAAPSPEASAFERQVFRVQTVMREKERLNQIVGQIPLGRPHAGELELSSGFGARLDPFLRSWAMHSGIDFRGATGEPVFASGGGRVSHAGSMGGYGLMVEIDHGNGLSTRYAHLSRIETKEGETVRAGHRIGRVGSTGRSTGPHLHYETRINGDAIDPMRFVRAGLRLAEAD
ncbi:MAG: M23 family metallopeptidase [Phreatobacter sp.]|uniref:M23 family metallopeptidase n=1 Tax=Phreatobacter sp. TaxID=1966341 RepID=UPI001A3B12C6|nr:M23 family metallopeptidase [Phreatobacter sp.]MBL8568449.1 M23 family metallopeptidase [Phreatobacter sp.]